ncbi:PAS domain-containing sensor histidine kinase [Iodobacter fluviatilis]|uniref:histidine kinase n=1 Tax=Iodobacter fluviatilis TaxID=537 RepID=A0A7G3G953_9NEIS|nr:PAS domain-containing sensor histidine kinase [Iodobacter fluviatilis]
MHLLTTISRYLSAHPWFLPRLALVLFLATVLGLFAYLRHGEREEARLVLISDVLWVEQNLRFVLGQSEERLAALLEQSRDGSLSEAEFRGRAHLVIGANAAITGIQLRTKNQSFSYGQRLSAEVTREPIALAKGIGRPSYTVPLYPKGMIALILAEHDLELVASIALPKLLQQQVPWWFAYKYRLAMIDVDGREVASKSKIEADDTNLSYQLPFDLVSSGLLLRITAYRHPTGLVQKLLTASVIGLALIVLFSWWRLRRQMQARILAENALREEHAFRTAMENSLSVGMRARDMQGRIVYVNPAFCGMVGYSPEELIGTLPPYPYWKQEDIAGHQAQNDIVLSGRAPHEGFESMVRHRDGHSVATRVYTTPLIDATGKQRGWMSSVVDITALKAAEAREREQEEMLRHTGKLITMGEMASTLAHELNQPLMAMSNYASAARQFANQNNQEMLDSTLSKIAGQAQRAAAVVKRIREFVQKRTPLRSYCDLNDIASNAFELIDASARSQGVRLHFNLAADLPQIHADEVLLGQVVLNLLRNALDASGEQPQSRRDVWLATSCDKDGVYLSVCDRGAGISPEVANRLFDAFFTTKSLGMGIGLNICRSILEQHQGKLWFEAHPQGGTYFYMSLPR